MIYLFGEEYALPTLSCVERLLLFLIYGEYKTKLMAQALPLEAFPQAVMLPSNLPSRSRMTQKASKEAVVMHLLKMSLELAPVTDRVLELSVYI